MQTPLQEFIADILSGKVIDTLANQKYYLDKEKQAIVIAFGDGQDDCSYSESEGIIYNSDGEEYYNRNYNAELSTTK